MWSIWSIGDYKFLAAVLNSVAAWAGTGQPKRVAAIGMLLSFIILGLQGLQKGGQMPPFQNILIGWIVFAFLFGPGVTVVVKDTYSVQVEVVDNVPFGMAATGSILSNLAHELTSSMEQAFSLPKMTEDGFGSTLALLLKQRENGLGPANHNITGGSGAILGNLEQTLTNYIQDCTMVGIQRKEKKEEHILNSTDHLASIYWGSDIYYTKTFLPVSATEGAGVLRTCNEAYNEIANHMNSPAFWGGWENYLDSFLGPNSVTRTQLALDAIVGAGKNAQDYMTAALYRDVYERAMRQGQADSNDIAGTIITTSAREQRNVQWAAESSLFISVAKPMMTFFEALIYAVTPFMAFLVVLVPIGLSLAMKYCMTAIWVQLWMPVMAILNFYINFIAQKRLGTLDSQLDITSIAGMIQANSQLADWMATAGMLAAATPMITMSLVYGGAVSATALAQRVSGKDHIDEKSMSPPLMSQNAGVTMAQNQWDKTSGLRTTGAEGALQSISFGDALQSTMASSQGKMAQSSQALESSLTKSLGASNQWTESGGLSQGAIQSLSARGTKTHDWAMKQAAAIAKAVGNDKIDQEKLAGQLIASGGGGLGNLLAGAVKGDFLATLTSGYDATTANKLSTALQESGIFDHGSSSRADMVRAMGHDVKNEYGTTYGKSENETDKKDLGSKLAQLETDSKEFKQSQALASHYGSETSMPLNTMAEQAVRNGALPGLDQSIANIGADMPGIFNERDALANRFKNQHHMSPDSARAAANLSILDRYGKRNDDIGQKARSGLVAGIHQATGQAVDPAVQAADPSKNSGLAPGVAGAAAAAAAEVKDANLGEGVPVPGATGHTVEAGIGKAQQKVDAAPGQIHAQNAQNIAKINQEGAAGLAAKRAEYATTAANNLAQRTYSPNLGHTHVNKANGLLSGMMDVAGQTMAHAMAAVDGGVRGAWNGASAAYEKAQQDYAEAVKNGAAPGALTEKFQALGQATNELDLAAGNVMRDLFSNPGQALKELTDAGIGVGDKLFDALSQVVDSSKSGVEAFGAMMNIPLATIAGGVNGAIDGEREARGLNMDVYYDSQKDIALAAGATEEQAGLYASARMDLASRLGSAFGAEGPDGFNLGYTVNGQGYDYGANLTGPNADLKRDAILSAARSGDLTGLNHVGVLNSLDGAPHHVQPGEPPSFGFDTQGTTNFAPTEAGPPPDPRKPKSDLDGTPHHVQPGEPPSFGFNTQGTTNFAPAEAGPPPDPKKPKNDLDGTPHHVQPGEPPSFGFNTQGKTNSAPAEAGPPPDPKKPKSESDPKKEGGSNKNPSPPYQIL